jgi:Berberine and berberine like
MPTDNPTAAYYNYLFPTLADWERGYFGKNYPRLQGIKDRYDPLGVFTKPFTPQGTSRP